jgi:hypothetical protein
MSGAELQEFEEVKGLIARGLQVGVLTYAEITTATAELDFEDADIEELHGVFECCEIELVEEIDSAASLFIDRGGVGGLVHRRLVTLGRVSAVGTETATRPASSASGDQFPASSPRAGRRPGLATKRAGSGPSPRFGCVFSKRYLRFGRALRQDDLCAEAPIDQLDETLVANLHDVLRSPITHRCYS